MVFHRVLLCFGWSPLVFLSFLVLVLFLKGKPKENYWKTNPSRLRGLSGASFWVSLASACSGAPSPGLPLSLSLLASSGLLWLALPPSFLSLSSFTRNKEEIRLWGLSGASVWGPLSFLFHALRREENTVWAALDLLWAPPFSISPTQPALGRLLRDFP